MPSKRHVLTLLGLSLLATSLYWVGGRAVLDVAARMDPRFIPGAAAAIMVSTLLGACNVYLMAQLRPAIGFAAFLTIYWRSWAIGISLPGQVADLFSTAWQLKRYRTTRLSFIAGRLLADKAITVLCMLAAAALLPYLLGLTPLRTSALLMVGILAGSLPTWLFLRFLGRRPQVNPSRLQPVFEAASVPWPLALQNLGLSLLKMALTGLGYWLVFTGSTANTPGYVATTVIAHAAGLVAYIPISFNGLGTVEISAIGLFARLGVPASVVLGCYLLLRVLTLALAWLPTLLWTPDDHCREPGEPVAPAEDPRRPPRQDDASP